MTEQEVPEKFIVRKEKKEKRPEKPSPFRIYPSNDTSVPVAFMRISHFDDWKQRYVVEARTRSQCGVPRKGWKPIAWFTRRGDWLIDRQYDCEFVENLEAVLCLEAADYNRRALEWVNAGKSLDDLHWAMARENGTLPRADRPLSQEEVKYD